MSEPIPLIWQKSLGPDQFGYTEYMATLKFRHVVPVNDQFVRAVGNAEGELRAMVLPRLRDYLMEAVEAIDAEIAGRTLNHGDETC